MREALSTQTHEAISNRETAQWNLHKRELSLKQRGMSCLCLLLGPVGKRSNLHNRGGGGQRLDWVLNMRVWSRSYIGRARNHNEFPQKLKRDLKAWPEQGSKRPSDGEIQDDSGHTQTWRWQTLGWRPELLVFNNEIVAQQRMCIRRSLQEVGKSAQTRA